MNLLIGTLFALCVVVTADNYVRVCYYTNWAQYRTKPAKYLPENIDPTLCTHIIYAFSQIKDNTLEMFEWNDDVMYERVVDLKKTNPSLKVLLAVGGWNHETTSVNGFGRFSTMVNSDNYRLSFIESAIRVLRQYDFDGFDLDWEYPGSRENSPPGDKQKFTQFCRELREAFDADAKVRRMERLMLTAAVPAGHETIDAGYEISELAKYLDILNLMTYDLHGSWDKRTGHQTAMASDGAGAGREKLTVPYAVNYWIQGGFPAEKIALGLATYGRAFRLDDPGNNGLGASASKPYAAPTGPLTNEGGFMAYYEICQAGLTVVEENSVMAPYGYKDTVWVGYDNEKSLVYKVNTLIKGKGLAGAMFWAIDLDDFTGACGNGKYPLLSAVNNALKGNLPPLGPKPSSSPNPVSPSSPTSASSSSSTLSSSSSPTPSSSRSPKTETICRSTGIWAGQSAIDDWCTVNCKVNNCPAEMCKCTGN